MSRSRSINIFIAIVFTIGSGTVNLLLPADAEAVRSIVFPVIGPASYSNDYTAPRTNGPHHAIDIFAKKMQRLVAVADGTVTYVAYPQQSWGYSLTMEDADGYVYRYIHINNDTPGTDNGRGGAMRAYATDMRAGNVVKRGQHIGWVGDSGNAENTPPHLHFEMFNPEGEVVNPYLSLNYATRLLAPVDYPQLPNEILPYGKNPIALNVAMGNLDGDAESEVVTGAGAGGGPHVKAYDDDNTSLPISFHAYNSNFTGGVDVAIGDVDGGGDDEIITGAGPGGGPHVKVFKANGTKIIDIMAYSPSFTGGVRVAAGDLDGDGIDEIITGAGPGGGPHVKVFDENGTKILGFPAYGANFTGGVDVAGGNVAETSADEIITGAGPGGGPHVKVFRADATKLSDFLAYEATMTGGVRVSADNVRVSISTDEIVTVIAHGYPYTKMFDSSGTALSGTMFVERWWVGYHDAAAGFDKSRAVTGLNRRATLREGLD